MSKSPTFSMDIAVEAADIDELNHVSNLVYVRWVQQVAEAHSRTMGYDHDAYRELGAVFVVRRHEIDYLRPAFLADRIRLSTWVDTWKAASSVRMTSIARVDSDAGQVELARARSVWALIDLGSGRPTRIPKTLRAAFEEHPGEQT